MELAYEKVEELTLANERARMARDLHDTLSQGLAGLVMQLEAMNANLNKNNINIKDDGVGFDVKLLDKLFGRYGIIGMTERVKVVKGKIKIKSERKEGTSINIVIPIEEGKR